MKNRTIEFDLKEKEKKDKSPLDFNRIKGLVKPEKFRLITGTIALFISSGISLYIPKLIGNLIDSLKNTNGSSLNQSTVILLVLFAISGVAGAFRAYLFTSAGEKIVADLRTKLYKSIVEREIAFFDSRKTGELLNRLSSDTTVLQNTVTVNLSMLLRNSLQIIGAIVILLWTSWKLTLVMLSIVPIVAIGAGFYGKALRKVSTKVQDSLAIASEVAEETIASIRTVRIFASEKGEIKRYEKAVDDSYQQANHRAKLIALFTGGVSFAGYAAIAAVLWYGGKLMISGSLSFGELTSFILYTFTLAIGIATLSSLWADFAKASGSSKRVFELIDQADNNNYSHLIKPEKISGKIEFSNIYFSYPTRENTKILKGLSFTLNSGKVYALVGPSGGGKSTIASLISRLYEPNKGELILDNMSYSKLDSNWLRKNIGVVNQEPTLFATSIKNNISYANPNANIDLIEKVAKAANAHDFIQDFPDGYETLVGERGVRLSGGQKQRIAIARALLKNPKILLLDEATSALDSESEFVVQEALERLMVGRTTLVIAHRLSTVKKADQVMVLENGKIVESGSHQDLIELNGLYKRLVEHQFKN